jgi:hypothetical protein
MRVLQIVWPNSILSWRWRRLSTKKIRKLERRLYDDAANRWLGDKDTATVETPRHFCVYLGFPRSGV